MSLEEAHGITHACATPAPAAPAVTEAMVEAAEVAYVREIARQIDDGKTVADRSAGIRLALAAALAAAGKGRA